MDEILVWIGLDVGKADHHATVMDAAGEVRFARAVRNDEKAIDQLLDAAGERAALVIDQPRSIGTLAVAVARRRGIPVAYVPGLVMRRASELYPGEAKTDRRDSFVIADTARIHQARVHWLAAGDELLEELRVLSGHDDDLAHDRTRAANRLRDMLLQAAPAVERVLGPRLEHPAVRALLERYPTPTAMRAAGKRRLIRLVTPRAPRMGARLVDELLTALGAQTVVVPAEETIGRVIRDLAIELTRSLQRASASPRRSRRSSYATLRRRSCSASRESERGPEPGSSPRSVTSPDSPPPDTSPPTPA